MKYVIQGNKNMLLSSTVSIKPNK